MQLNSSLSTRFVALSLTAFAAVGPRVGKAAGFQLLEQSGSGLGNAYAGSAAVAENASTIYFNPAGMTQLPGINVSAGVNAIWPSFKFKDSGSTNPLALGGGPARGGDGGDAGGLGVIPNGYVSWQLNDRWYLGLGIGTPFGLMTDYDDGWKGRFQSQRFEVQTININPSVAYRVNDSLSLGAGLNWQYISADYRKETVLGPGRFTDARVKLDGDAWGWNIGMLLNVTPDTRLGLSYRSAVRQHAKGDTDLDGIGSFGAHANVELPDTAIFSVMHTLSSRWDLLADVSRTGWSSIQDLKIKNEGIPGDTMTLKFRDTWRIALGANYKIDSQWKLKFGVAWDQSPVHDEKYRPTSLPDTDRWWFSAGVQYQLTPLTSVDLGYTYLYLNKARIDNDGENPATTGRMDGTYSNRGNILGIQVTSRF